MTDEMTYTSYGLWGSGKVDPGNADALLRDFIADDLGNVYVPVKPDKDYPRSLKETIGWFEDDELLGPGGTDTADDMLEALVDLQAEGDEAVLIVLWPEQPTEEDARFARSFIDSGIRVVDLCQALDDLVDPVAYVPDKKSKAPEEPGHGDDPDWVPEKPRRVPRKLSDTKAMLDAEIAEAAEIMEKIDKPEILATPSSPRMGEAYVKFMKDAEFDAHGSNVTTDLMNAIDNYIEFKVQQIILARLKRDYEFQSGIGGNPIPVPFASPSLEAAGSEMTTAFVPLDCKGQPLDIEPPFDGPYQEGMTQRCFMTADGMYTSAKGKRITRGRTEVYLSDGEIESLKAAGQWSE